MFVVGAVTWWQQHVLSMNKPCFLSPAPKKLSLLPLALLPAFKDSLSFPSSLSFCLLASSWKDQQASQLTQKQPVHCAEITQGETVWRCGSLRPKGIKTVPCKTQGQAQAAAQGRAFNEAIRLAHLTPFALLGRRVTFWVPRIQMGGAECRPYKSVTLPLIFSRSSSFSHP